MIIKSYEIQKKISNFLKHNLFLLYGENDGLKKDIRESIKIKINQQDNHTEFLSFYENSFFITVTPNSSYSFLNLFIIFF